MKFDNKKLLVAALLAGTSDAANWNWGICGALPESDLTDFSMQNYEGQWYEIYRDNALKSWECVTQEVTFIQSDTKWPLQIYNYVNGNQVIESEKAVFDSDGTGETKMLSKKKKVSILDANTESDTGYALVYSCATDWWMFGIPRYTENAWILSRSDSIDEAKLEELKSAIARKVPSYASSGGYAKTVQGGDCKYNSVLTARREAAAPDVPSDTPTPVPTPVPDTPTDPDTPTPVPDTPTPTPDVPSSDDEDVPSTIPSVPTNTDATTTGTTAPADSKDGDSNGVLLLICGILGGSLATIILLYCICKSKFGEQGKDDRDRTDKSRLLQINGSVATGQGNSEYVKGTNS